MSDNFNISITSVLTSLVFFHSILYLDFGCDEWFSIEIWTFLYYKTLDLIYTCLRWLYVTWLGRVRGWVPIHYGQIEVEVQVPRIVFTDTGQLSWKSLLPILLSVLERDVGCLITALWGWKSWLPIWLLQVWERPKCFAEFSCSRAMTAKSCFFLNCPFPDPLAQENRLLGGIFFAVVGVSRRPASSAPGVGYIRQKENRESSALCPSLGPGSLASLFFPPSRVVFCLFYI